MGAKLTHNRGLGKQWIMKRIKHKRTRESNKCSYAIQPKVEQKKGGFVVVKFFFHQHNNFGRARVVGLSRADRLIIFESTALVSGMLLIILLP